VVEPLSGDVVGVAVETAALKDVQGDVLDIGVVVGVPGLLDNPRDGRIWIRLGAGIEALRLASCGVADELAQPHAVQLVQ